MAGFCEYGIEPSDSIKFGEFLNWMRTYWLLRNVYKILIILN